MTSERPAVDTVFLGVDLGTQGVRAAAVDPAGRVVGQGSEPLRMDSRQGPRHEQNPQEWWDALCSATRQALHQLSGVPIGGVAIDSTSGTVVVEDRDLHPVTAGLMYDDTRAADLAPALADAGASVWSKFGVALQGSWALPRALWLQRNDLIPDGGRVVHQGDHMVSRLTGHACATDSSQALKTGVDLLRLAWPTAELATAGFDTSVLPKVVVPSTVLGLVSVAAAEQTGIPVGTTVKAGMTDGCASQIACGALAPGRWSSTLGTTLVLKGATQNPVRDPSGAVYGHRSPDGGWLPGGASSIGAGILARDYRPDELDPLTAQAPQHEPARGVCYPLEGQGERFPFVAPQARGFYDGVPDDRAARFAATLQGIALTERLAYDRLRALGAPVTGAVRFAGGSTRNDYWNRLRCDVLGLEVQVPAFEGAAMGMAILAAATPGTVAETADRMVTVARSYSPDPDRGSRFESAYQQFVEALVQHGYLERSDAPVTAEAAR